MAWIKLNPLTRRRFARFRKIKRGYYSFLILAAAIVLSIFAPYLAESRAVMVVYQGKLFFPTFEFLDMGTFGQTPPPGWSTADLETDYLRLKNEWQAERYYYGKESREAGGDAQKLAALDKKYPNRNSVVVMPLIPWDPYQNDFWYNEILRDIQPLLDAGRGDKAERLARRGHLAELAEAISEHAIPGILADPRGSVTRRPGGVAPGGTVSSLCGLGTDPPTAPRSNTG